MNVSKINIHLNTDILSGELQIDPYPAEGHHTPVDVREWPDVRDRIEAAAREKIPDANRWEAYLASDRTGERFDVRVGHCLVDSEGEIREIEIDRPNPEEINW